MTSVQESSFAVALTSTTLGYAFDGSGTDDQTVIAAGGADTIHKIVQLVVSSTAATVLTLKSSTAGTILVLDLSADSPVVLPLSAIGWAQCAANEALTYVSSAAATVSGAVVTAKV